jgi:TatD DNase family protein
MIFDSHAHYDDAAFDTDRHDLLAALPHEGVAGVINAASSISSARLSLALAERYPHVWAAVGIHPEAVATMTDTDLAAIEAMAAHPRAVAIGEIGLDYHWEDNAPREVQIARFEQQLELANRLSLPVIVHDRDAHEDTLRLLQKHRPRGVLHCFSGHVEMMREVVALGMSIGLGGAVTFKNAKKPVAVAAAVPLDRLLLETDAPYMAPVPHRGKRCDSRLIAHTAAVIAEVRGMATDELLAATEDNAKRLFSL